MIYNSALAGPGILSTANGVPVARVGLGCMGMSEFYGERDDVASLRVLHEAFDQGYRHFDSADFYGQGHNEQLLARFLSQLGQRRAEILIATKCGLRRSGAASVEIDSRPEYVRAACDASLRRLGVEYIDLYYLHRRSREVPVEETMGELASLVASGKCRHIGLSEVSESTLRRAHAVHPLSALQSEYSLWSRDVESGILEATAQLGIALVAYSPIGRGFLSGQVTRDSLARPGDIRGLLPRFAQGNFEHNQALLGSLRGVADELGGASMSQVALCWVLSRGANVYAIPGTRRAEHLRTNLAAQDLTLLPEQIARLEHAFARDAVHGTRYPEALLQTVNT
jgi:aryl-alcohol dehydrogenase-like predicted oxidoreductase